MPDHRFPDPSEAEYTRPVAQRAQAVPEADSERRTWAAFWAFVAE